MKACDAQIEQPRGSGRSAALPLIPHRRHWLSSSKDTNSPSTRPSARSFPPSRRSTFSVGLVCVWNGCREAWVWESEWRHCRFWRPWDWEPGTAWLGLIACPGGPRCRAPLHRARSAATETSRSHAPPQITLRMPCSCTSGVDCLRSIVVCLLSPCAARSWCGWEGSARGGRAGGATHGRRQAGCRAPGPRTGWTPPALPAWGLSPVPSSAILPPARHAPVPGVEWAGDGGGGGHADQPAHAPAR